MRSTLVVLSLFAVSACRCDGPGVTSRFGALVFVQPGETGREVLLTEATFPAPETYMGETANLDVPVRNVGTSAVSIVSATKTEGDDAFSIDAAGFELAGTSDGVLRVTFSPPQASDATLTEEAHRAVFDLLLEGAAAGADHLTLTLTGSAQARDCFVPKTIDFGAVPLNAAVTSTLTLRNGRALAQQTTVSALTGADASSFFTTSANESITVPPQGSADLAVRFSPLEARDYSATMTVQRDTTCPAAQVTLLGRGDEQALSWTPDALDFGRLPLNEVSDRVVTIVNGSNVALSLNVVLAAGAFSAVDAPATIAPHAATPVTLRCKPTTLGPITGQAELDIGTEPITPARINLKCVGGGPRIRVDPNPLSFGTVPKNLPTSRRLLVQNVGTAPPSLGDTSNNLFLGTAGQLPWFAVVPKNAATSPSDFNVGLVSGYDATTGLPAISGRNFAEFQVTVTHPGGAQREADLLVYSNDAQTPIARIPMVAGVADTTGCTVTIDPPGANFGPAPRGAALQRTITVTNSATSGNGCLVSGIEMAPGSSTAFFVASPSVPSFLVLPNQTKTIVVLAVVPGDAPIGEYLRGTLRLRVANEPLLRALPVDLQVSRCLIIDPPSLNLGVVQTGCTSASKAVNLYNACGVPIEVSNLVEATAPFRVTSSPFSGAPVMLSPSDHLTVLVAVQPMAPGALSGALTFESTEGGVRFPQSIALSATANATGIQNEGFAQSTTDVDILMVIDDSGSMSDEQSALASNFASFISSASSGPGNWHIGVVTTDVVGGRGVLRSSPGNPTVLTPTLPNVDQLFAAKVMVGTGGSGLEQPLDSMSLALTEPNLSGANAGFIRTDAALAVVIVTDALEQSTHNVGSYVSTLRNLKNGQADQVSVSVVGPFTAPSASCSTEGQVDDGRFTSITTQTNGLRANICTTDWAMSLRDVSTAVFATRRTFILQGAARGMGTMTVRVDGVIATNWSFDPVTNTVLFTSPPPAGSSITIEYATACF